jgi:hypothetical protein
MWAALLATVLYIAIYKVPAFFEKRDIFATDANKTSL